MITASWCRTVYRVEAQVDGQRREAILLPPREPTRAALTLSRYDRLAPEPQARKP